MKRQENQTIRTGGILTLFALLGACVLAITPVWNGGNRTHSEKTLRRAEGLAYQIIEIQKASRRQRTPASQSEFKLDQGLGRMGQDPWGQPFRFRLVKSETHTKVLVWSDGPNQKSDTLSEKIESVRDDAVPQFDGDDLGIMVSYK